MLLTTIKNFIMNNTQKYIQLLQYLLNSTQGNTVTRQGYDITQDPTQQDAYSLTPTDWSNPDNRTITGNSVPTVNKMPELTTAVNWDFISGLEGKGVTTGYIPKKDGKVLGKSGVTIGTGFDLGQHSVQDLNKMGLPEELVNKLAPYTGKKKGTAASFLSSNPLELSKEEVEILDSKVKDNKLEQIKRIYNSSTPGNMNFDNLSPEQQTVITSLGFQYGDLRTAAPNTWKKIVQDDWNGVYSNLRDFGDAYSTRRNKEADLLANYLKLSSL